MTHERVLMDDSIFTLKVVLFNVVVVVVVVYPWVYQHYIFVSSSLISLITNLPS